MSFCHFVFKMGFFFELLQTIGLKKAEAVRRYSSKKVFLKISYYSQENTCVGVLKAKGL